MGARPLKIHLAKTAIKRTMGLQSHPTHPTPTPSPNAMILQAFRNAFRRPLAQTPTDADILIRDNAKPDTSNFAYFKVSLTTLAAKVAALLTGNTINAAVITDPAAGTTGVLLTKRATFAETATGVSHVATIAVPAGAVIHSIRVIPRVLWAPTTSATLKVGDTADDDGFFTGVNLKATDLLVGEVLDTTSSTLWGGKEGAYLVAATGRRGPTSSNFGMSYVAGSNILGTITVVDPTATTGRTDLEVSYSVPTTVSPVVT